MQNMTCIVFPSLSDDVFAQVDLAAETRIALDTSAKVNPMRDGHVQEVLLDAVRRKHKCDHTYGGYGEDRSEMWRGFEDKSKKMIHLGIDVNNLDAGTPLTVPRPCTVVHTSYDAEHFNGWGGRVVLEMETAFRGCKFLIVGHLDPDTLPGVGTHIKYGEMLGLVGGKDSNGGWFTHVHFQLAKNFEAACDIDGYLLDSDIDMVPDDYAADPTELLFAAAPVKENTIKT